MRNNKQPKRQIEPDLKREPKIGPFVRGGLLGWRFSSVDKEGPFGWTILVDSDDYKGVMEKLHQFETMQESDMRQHGSHPVEIGSLCRAARDRLRKIGHDDLDGLMSFRLTAKARVWCRMVNNMMLVLWWDPYHQVCPSLKKHT